jgi:hypothetical protein
LCVVIFIDDCRVWRYERIGKREFGEEGEMKREKGKEERRGRE